MRRFLIIFLLFALPLQVSWAAVAIYCNHESGAAAQHFGHHEHEHQATNTDPAQDASKDTSTLTVDTDCVVCHLGGVGMMPMAFSSTASNAPHAERIAAGTTLLSFVVPDRPERPKWRRAV
jgi:cytochrome c5